MNRVLLFAAVLLISAPAPGLDRLFFTPAEREALDRQATRIKTPETRNKTQTDIDYAGYVRRSDGNVTYWLDGKPVSDQPPHALKPGQQMESGRRLESWQAP
jgi:hypothetical protein